MIAITDPARTRRVDAYMPLPLGARQQAILQWSQVLLPIVGSAAAGVHAYFHGIAPGTFAVTIGLALATALGVTVGFHRLFVHRSFETVGAVRYALAILGSMAAEHHLFLWVGTHRRHHRFSDRPGDPHSPNICDESFRSRCRELFHAHIGSVLTDRLSAEYLSYIPDLRADRTLCRIQRLYLVWVALGFAIPALVCYAIAGTVQAAIGGMLWGGFVRTLVSTQLTYTVNSIGHVWGDRPFESHDLSRNNALIALVSLGEGWHNNHHAFPTSARHGLTPRQPDASYQFIRLLQRLGLAWNVKTPTPAQIAAKLRVDAADGSEQTLKSPGLSNVA